MIGYVLNQQLYNFSSTQSLGDTFEKENVTGIAHRGTLKNVHFIVVLNSIARLSIYYLIYSV